MLDQDFILISEMTQTSNIYNVMSRYRNLQGKAIHSLTDQERRVIKVIVDMGLI